MDGHKFISFGFLTQHPVGESVKVRKRGVSHQDPVEITRNVAIAKLDATNRPGSQESGPHETKAKTDYSTHGCPSDDLFFKLFGSNTSGNGRGVF